MAHITIINVVFFFIINTLSKKSYSESKRLINILSLRRAAAGGICHKLYNYHPKPSTSNHSSIFSFFTHL